MITIHWFELKQIDRVTNFSSRTELIKAGIKEEIKVRYYCTFLKCKKYFNLNGQIKYLGRFKNRYLKGFEFRILVILRALMIVLRERRSVIMANQGLIILMLPALALNSLLKRDNRFIVDIRTTPIKPSVFNHDMRKFHAGFSQAVRFFHGFSFITPFMERYVMERYNTAYKSVNWSSGVDAELFNPKRFVKKEKTDCFKLFYHGGISESRGSLDLVRACESLVNMGYNIELKQVGFHSDKAVYTYIKEKRLEKWCILLEALPLTEMPKMISGCDLPVLPFPDFMAWRVSSPIKLMEYLAMGKKVLAPDMECFTDVFGKSSDKVFYYERESVDPVSAIAEAIKEIIDNNLLNEVRFYPENRAYVMEHYTWEKQASKLFNFCKSLWES